MFLDDALRFEFIVQGIEEAFVLFGVLVEVGGFEDGVTGAEAVLDGVATGDCFAFGRSRTG